MPMKDLLEYHSYHTFLEDFVAAKKAEKEWFSLRYFAEKIGMDQGNLVRIFQGKRHLSTAAVERLIAYLDLDGRRADYLRTLVVFNKSKSDAKARAAFDKLMAIAAPEAKVLEPQQFEFYRKWYHTAIYNLMDCFVFRGDDEALAQQLNPAITAIQAKESIALLLQLGLIRRRGDGRYVQTHNLITSGESWRSYAVHTYQEATLKLALHSLENHPRNIRDFSTLSMSIASKDLEKVRELTREYRSSILNVVQESNPADAVYQLNIQLFPMTKVSWKGGSR
ncbi:MAG TPA: TIGR02147 family protein [Fibrobacteraceae bacterium]|nr:TIGR02147 family protein [Fibrobacteraceae bacterium]